MPNSAGTFHQGQDDQEDREGSPNVCRNAVCIVLRPGTTSFATGDAQPDQSSSDGRALLSQPRGMVKRLMSAAMPLMGRGCSKE